MPSAISAEIAHSNLRTRKLKGDFCICTPAVSRNCRNVKSGRKWMPDFNQVETRYSDLAANDGSFWVGVLMRLGITSLRIRQVRDEPDTSAILKPITSQKFLTTIPLENDASFPLGIVGRFHRPALSRSLGGCPFLHWTHSKPLQRLFPQLLGQPIPVPVPRPNIP
jgi:hypothetical protein